MSDRENDTDRRPRPGSGRIMVPWWALTVVCGLVGLAVAEWPGAVVGGTLGYIAWRLR